MTRKSCILVRGRFYSLTHRVEFEGSIIEPLLGMGVCRHGQAESKHSDTVDGSSHRVSVPLSRNKRELEGRSGSTLQQILQGGTGNSGSSIPVLQPPLVAMVGRLLAASANDPIRG